MFGLEVADSSLSTRSGALDLTIRQKANQVRATYHIIYGLHQKRQ